MKFWVLLSGLLLIIHAVPSHAGDYDSYVQTQKKCYDNILSEVTCYFKSRYDLLDSIQKNTESISNPIILSGIRGTLDTKNSCPLQIKTVYSGELDANQSLTITNCTLIEQYNSIYLLYPDDTTVNNTILIKNKTYTISYLVLGSIENEATLLKGSISSNKTMYGFWYNIFAYFWLYLGIFIAILFTFLGLNQLRKNRTSIVRQ